jgi:hypothetical protein
MAERTGSVTRIGRWTWCATILDGTRRGETYTLTRKGAERRVRRQLARMARQDAWRSVSIPASTDNPKAST